jgi:hypothetical protein
MTTETGPRLNRQQDTRRSKCRAHKNSSEPSRLSVIFWNICSTVTLTALNVRPLEPSIKPFSAVICANIIRDVLADERVDGACTNK